MQNALQDILTGPLTDVLQRTVTNSNRSKAAEPVSQTAIESALTALLTGLQSNVKSKQGAQKLDTALQKDHDGSVFQNIEAALTSPASQADGSKILSHIFGSKADKVAATAGKKSGIDTQTMIGIMIALAPLVLGKLGEMKKGNNLNADSLAQTVTKQKVPDNGLAGTLTSLLDADKDGNVIDDIMGMARSVLGSKK